MYKTKKTPYQEPAGLKLQQQHKVIMIKQEQNIKHWKTTNNSIQQKLQKECEREREMAYSFTNLEPKVHNVLNITKVNTKGQV